MSDGSTEEDGPEGAGVDTGVDATLLAAVEQVAAAIGEALGAALAENRRRHPSLESAMARLCLSALDTVTIHQLAHAAASEAERLDIEKPDALGALLRQHIQGITRGSFAVLALHEVQARVTADTPAEEPSHVVH